MILTAQYHSPPIDISNSFERQMYMAKTLQNPDKTVNDLVEELWVSQRTIDDDLGRLRGIKDPIQVCGEPFLIKETMRRDARLSFTSTAHPFFLTWNLTQVICTLKGLKHMSEDSAYKEYALISTKAIWRQLSDYARDRIIKVLTRIDTR